MFDKRREMDFRASHAKMHGWPIEDYDWCLSRERLRNWQKRTRVARDARLRMSNDGKWATVMFCPRCGGGIAFIESEEATPFDLKPLNWNDSYPAYCGDCEEKFEIKSVPANPDGMRIRRAVLIGRKILKALRPPQPNKQYWWQRMMS